MKQKFEHDINSFAYQALECITVYNDMECFNESKLP